MRRARRRRRRRAGTATAGSAIAAARSRRDRWWRATSPTPAIATPVSTQAIVIDGLRQANRAIAIATIAISSDGPRLVDKRARPWRQRREAAQRQVQQIEALQAERGHRADKADAERGKDRCPAASPLPDPGGEEHAADADEQAEIDPDPRQPDQDGNEPAAARLRRLRRRRQRRSKTPAIPPTGWPSSETTR